MPTYEYESRQFGFTFETIQRITSSPFKNMKELREHMINNGDITLDKIEDLKKIYNHVKDSLKDNKDVDDNDVNLADFYECLTTDDEEIFRVVTGGVGVIFKGMGWPSMTYRNTKYTGKNKKQVERMREERARKNKTGLSTPELAAELGVKGKVTDNVVPNNQWDDFSKSDQSKLRKIGVRPSRDYT